MKNILILTTFVALTFVSVYSAFAEEHYKGSSPPSVGLIAKNCEDEQIVKNYLGKIKEPNDSYSIYYTNPKVRQGMVFSVWIQKLDTNIWIARCGGPREPEIIYNK